MSESLSLLSKAPKAVQYLPIANTAANAAENSMLEVLMPILDKAKLLVELLYLNQSLLELILCRAIFDVRPMPFGFKFDVRELLGRFVESTRGVTSDLTSDKFVFRIFLCLRAARARLATAIFTPCVRGPLQFHGR